MMCEEYDELSLPFAIGNNIIQERFDNHDFSNLHFAYNVITREKCCVKIIEKFNQEAESIRNEIEILKSLKHKNIIQFRDSFETNSHFFIFQEFWKGGSLFDGIISNRKIGEDQAKKVFHQLMKVLKYFNKMRYRI
jgi:serine/threonine protein kinase